VIVKRLVSFREGQLEARKRFCDLGDMMGRGEGGEARDGTMQSHAIWKSAIIKFLS